MNRRLVKYAKSIKAEFVRYFVIGVSTVAIDMGTLFVLKEYVGFLPVIAVALNQLLVITYNFNLNKYWSFRNKEVPHKQFVRYLMLAGFNYTFSILIMLLFNQFFGLDYLIVRLASIIVMVAWTFFVYKYWVYKPAIKKEEQFVEIL